MMNGEISSTHRTTIRSWFDDTGGSRVIVDVAALMCHTIAALWLQWRLTMRWVKRLIDARTPLRIELRITGHRDGCA